MYIFSGWRGQIFGWWFSRRNFLWERNYLGGELEGKLYAWRIYRNSYAKFFSNVCFLFPVSILSVETLRVIVQGKFLPGWNCIEDVSVGRGISPWRGLDFLALA